MRQGETFVQHFGPFRKCEVALALRGWCQNFASPFSSFICEQGLAFFLEPDPVYNLLAAGPQVYILPSVPVFYLKPRKIMPNNF